MSQNEKYFQTKLKLNYYGGCNLILMYMYDSVFGTCMSLTEESCLSLYVRAVTIIYM